MSGWMKKKLGEVCTLQRGFDLPTKQRKEGDYPLISSSGCTDMQAEAKISGPGVVTGRSGSIGSVFFINQDFWPLNTTLYVKDFHGNDPRFIYYLLRKFDLKRFTSGTGVPTLNRNSVHGELVYIPSEIDEQKRIVAIVDQAFEAIDVAIENTKQNLANARELFESYLNDVFDRKGDGWKDMTIGAIADHSFGKMLDARKNKGVLKPYLRNFNVRWFEFDLSDILEMPFEDSEQEKYTATKGDVLICEGGYPGRAAIWQEDEPIYFQKAIHRVRFQEPAHSKWFLYFIYSSDCNGNLKKHFTGTGIQHFTGQSLHGFKIPIPPISTVEKFVLQFDKLRQETQRLETIYRQKLAALTELKQSILQKAFTGELTADQEAP